MGGVLSRTFGSYETTHCLIERNTGQRVPEPTPVSVSIRTLLLYKTWLGRLLLELPITWWYLSWQHKRLAKRAASPKSRSSIASFMKSYKICPDDAVKSVEEFATLQEFFTRELKPGARPIAEPDDPTVAVMPADSRVVVYDAVDQAHRMWIKGRNFNVPDLLGHGYNASDWHNCAIAINRLAPADCHRLHAPVTGRVKKISRHGHAFMASKWVAVHSSLDIMLENERLVIEYETEPFGPVIMVPIGASEVGSVQPLVKEGQQVKKGDEVAIFAFGGSIMVTLFSANTIKFDADLIKHSQARCETRCNLGSSLGRATGVKPAATT